MSLPSITVTASVHLPVGASDDIITNAIQAINPYCLPFKLGGARVQDGHVVLTFIYEKDIS